MSCHASWWLRSRYGSQFEDFEFMARIRLGAAWKEWSSSWDERVSNISQGILRRECAPRRRMAIAVGDACPITELAIPKRKINARYQVHDRRTMRY